MKIEKTVLEILIRESVREVLEEQGFFQNLGSIAKQAVGVSSITDKNHQENLAKMTDYIGRWAVDILDSAPVLSKLNPTDPSFTDAAFEAFIGDRRIANLHKEDSKLHKILGVTPTTPQDRKSVQSLVTSAIYNVIDNIVEKKQKRADWLKSEKERQSQDRSAQRNADQQAYDERINKRIQKAKELGYKEKTQQWHDFVYNEYGSKYKY